MHSGVTACPHSHEDTVKTASYTQQTIANATFASARGASPTHRRGHRQQNPQALRHTTAESTSTHVVRRAHSEAMPKKTVTQQAVRPLAGGTAAHATTALPYPPLHATQPARSTHRDEQRRRSQSISHRNTTTTARARTRDLVVRVRAASNILHSGLVVRHSLKVGVLILDPHQRVRLGRRRRSTEGVPLTCEHCESRCRALRVQQPAALHRWLPCLARRDPAYVQC
jgi:hypothetical protein